MKTQLRVIKPVRIEDYPSLRRKEPIPIWKQFFKEWVLNPLSVLIAIAIVLPAWLDDQLDQYSFWRNTRREPRLSRHERLARNSVHIFVAIIVISTLVAAHILHP